MVEETPEQSPEKKKGFTLKDLYILEPTERSRLAKEIGLPGMIKTLVDRGIIPQKCVTRTHEPQPKDLHVFVYDPVQSSEIGLQQEIYLHESGRLVCQVRINKLGSGEMKMSCGLSDNSPRGWIERVAALAAALEQGQASPKPRGLWTWGRRAAGITASALLTLIEG